MSKIIAGTAFVLLAGATATGGILLAKGKHTEDKSSEPTYDHEIPLSLSAFKQDGAGNNEGCIQNTFPNLAALPTAADSGAAEVIGDNFFASGQKTTGCLVVNRDKSSYTASGSSSNNWKGNVRFLWSVKGGNKGFIVFLVGEASNDGTNKEIKWERISYTLSQSTEGSQAWTAKQKQELTKGTKSFKKGSDGNLTNTNFPRPHTNLGLKNNPDFWGLFSNASDLENICTASGCSGTPTNDTFQGYWEWESGTEGGNHKLSEWTQNMDTWWKEIFGEDSFKAKSATENQTGIWTNRVKRPPDTSA